MIHPKILSHEKVFAIALAWTDEEKAKHPHDKLGKFARKGTATTTASKSGGGGGTQYKRGKQRFTIESGETESAAYQRVLQSKREKHLQRKLSRMKRKEAAQKGFEDWRNQLREEQNVEIVQQAREGEYGTAELAGDVAKEVGILTAIQGTRNIGKRVFDKLAREPVQKLQKKQQQQQQTVKPAVGTTENPIRAQDVTKVKHGAKRAAKKAALPWAKVAAGAKTEQRKEAFKAYGTAQAQKAYKEYTENAFKDLAKSAGTVAVTQAAVSTGSNLVGASRFAKIAAPFARVGGAAMRVGGVLLNPAIAIPLTIAGAAAYFHHRKKKREALYAHERELMRRESEGYLPYKTTQDIHREAVAYATKRYAQQETEVKKRAIDEELSSPHIQARMQKAARKTARNAANAYSRHEGRVANNLMIEFSHAALNKHNLYDESKHPRDEKGRWTASPESNAELIKKTIKKPTSLKTHIASGTVVGAAIGTVNAPGIGTAIGATVGGGLAATRKLTLKKTFEAANHRALQESMGKNIVIHYNNIIGKHSDLDHKKLDGLDVIEILMEAESAPESRLHKELADKVKTYAAFRQAKHDEKQKAIETNTLHKLKFDEVDEAKFNKLF